jgi:CSLREA domain-containing protein
MKFTFLARTQRPYSSRVLTPRRIVSVAGCAAIVLLASLPLLHQSFQILPRSVLAQGRVFSLAQSDEALAPSAPIRPVSVSVINFAELAAKDAKTSKETKPNATPVLRAIHPPKTITEGDSAIAKQPALATPQGNEIHPLVSSPAPSQSFLAQEDGPEVGTGTFDIPPDTMGAVGPDKLFVNVNNNYRVQDKTTGAALSTVSINTFWSSTGASGVFDPRVQYDPYNNRWIVAATSNSDTATSSILVGVSATSDPLGTFTLFRFNVGCAGGAPNCDASGETADFPMLGFNKNWVAVGWNQFQVSGSGSFVSGKMLAIDYPTLRTGTATSTIFTVTLPTNIASFCMHPATTLSATEDTLYVPAHLSSASALYRLHKITGTPSAPSYVLDTVSKTRTGGAWTQPGGEILPQTCVGTPGVTCPTTPRFIDSGDAFIRSNVVFRNNNIWYAQTVGLPAGGLTHTAAQWTRIDTGGNFVDGGRVEDPTADSSLGEWYAYASITVNANNDALLGFSTFAKTHFARAGYAMRLGTDLPGTMGDPVIFKEGEDYYSKDFGGARNRWGDYSHSVVDPSNDLDFWTIQEYAGTRVIQDSQQTTNASRWGTWWAKIPPNGPPPSPTPTVSPTPAGCPNAFVITDNGDGDDVAPGNRVCATANGACTLRAAIEEANALTTCGTIDITFNVASPITLGITLPALNHNVNLNGPGANQLTVQRSTAGGTASFRIFTINSGRTVNVSGLTMSNGNVISGIFPNNSGGAVANSGTLTLTNIVASSNAAINGGGALFNNGTLIVANSTLTGNSTNLAGGAIYNVVGTTTIVNSTVSGNSAAGQGGGIYLGSSGITLTNVTVTNNRSDSDNSGSEQGGGISTLGGNATLKNTIVAGNFRGGTGTTASDFSNNGFTIVSSSAFNLFGTGGSGGLTNGVNNNQVDVSNPGLGLLANYGGPTMTHALLSGSPAINAGSNALATDQNNNPLTTDQRGVGFTRVANGIVDIGGFELQAGEIPPSPTPTPTPTATPTPTPTPTPAACFTFTVNSNADTNDASPGDGLCLSAGGSCTLRAAIQEANAIPSCGRIDINIGAIASPIILSTALPDINHEVNIKGPGANQLTLQRSTAGGTPVFRIFRSLTNRVVTISDLTIANGNAGSDDGGAINGDGPLTLVNCNFYGNTASRGGAIFFRSSVGLTNPLVLSNCNVGGTSAGQANAGWGIYASGQVTITGGSIVGNSSGGLVLSSGPNVLNGVVISDNTSFLDGGGADIWSGATFINCLIANNTAVGNGGGINVGGVVKLINSTISGNKSGRNGGGIENFSGGFGAQLTNVTVTNNRSDFDNSGGEQGGGIHNNSGIVSLNNSIIALNFRGGSGTVADDISGTVNSSSSFNLFGTGGAGGLVNGSNNNQVGVSNPGLGPLANYGGSMMTHALLSGSPAIDAGSNALAVDQNGNPLTTDQRGAGFNRIVNNTVDIGAFEGQPGGPPPTPTPTPTPSPTPAPSPTPTPATITVNSTSDTVNAGDGSCTLREAMMAANTNTTSGSVTGECAAGGGGSDTIAFSVSGTINLTSALPGITSDMTINGPGLSQLTVRRSAVSGTPNFRVFTINSGVTATISGLTISGGSLVDFGCGISNSGTLTLLNSSVSANGGGVGGGGIYNSGGTLTIMNSTVNGNNIETGGGGGIYNSGGALAITNSTVSGNSGPSFGGGGIYIGGGAVTITNSTVSGNNSSGTGGGINNSGGTLTLANSTVSGNTPGNGNGGGIANNSGTLTLTNSTVTGNITGNGARGGGIYFQVGTANIKNTIVANNTVGSGGSGPELFGTFNSQDYNLIKTTAGATLTGNTTHNITGQDPSLGPLANNGGPTMTHALLPGSPAIDAGDICVVNNSCSPALASVLTTDQRGTGFSRLVNAAVDIGAFEVQASPPPPTVQFSSATYTISETGPRVDITLTRAGDTTNSASVSFATNDAAGLTNCNVISGVASPRCDYENTIGTASWAAGDATSKSFSVAIVDDSYAEGNESFTVNLSSPSGATLGAQSTATVTITDNEAVNGPNPIDSTNFFVRQQYIDFLGREPDPPGFAGWTSTINNCTGDTTQCDRIHVSQLFFQSEEFQSRGYFVYRFYPVAFGRKPDYAEFVPDLARVSGFLDATQLEAAKVQFIADFMARPAFVSAYNSPNTPIGNQQYVDALLNTAGVTLSSRQAMINGLNNSTMTRAAVLRQIVESAEVSAKYNHQAYAVMEYFGYLRRQPDAFYLAWIDVLDQSNDPRGMVTGFVNSTEYRNRFGP